MSNELEQRVAAIEKELLQLKHKLQTNHSEKPWWEIIAGTFEGDSSYKEAMTMGAEYRRSHSPISEKRE